MSVRQLVLVLAAASLPLLRPAPLRGQETPVFSARSELVVLHVTVRDRKNAYVGDLSQDAFAVVEDGQAQSVKLFSDTDTPVTIGLLVDGSASMFGNRSLAVAGAAEFVIEMASPQTMAANLFLQRFQDSARFRQRAIIGRGRLGPEVIERLDLRAHELTCPIHFRLEFGIEREVDHCFAFYASPRAIACAFPISRTTKAPASPATSMLCRPFRMRAYWRSMITPSLNCASTM